jgi:hypothetical protein
VHEVVVPHTTKLCSPFLQPPPLVSDVNRAPVVGPVAYSTPRDQPLAIAAPTGVLANASDADRDALIASPIVQPAHGTLTLNSNGSFVYVPGRDYWGPDSFTFNVDDGQGGSMQGVASIAVIGECGRSPATGAGLGVEASDGPSRVDYVSLLWAEGLGTAVAPQT